MGRPVLGGQNQKAASVASLRWANTGKTRMAARKAMTAASLGGKPSNCFLKYSLSYCATERLRL
jgi:hypothetical protein